MAKRLLETATLLACLLSCNLAVQSQAQSSPKPKQGITNTQQELREESKLRMRLQFNPHDSDAHKKLIEILHKKYSFRAIVTEDASWLSNNRSDTWALNEIVGYAEGALQDPEFVIAQLRSQLSAVPRDENPEDYDNWSDELASKLEKRGRPEEALPLLSELVRLNPNEAGFWADYGDCLSALGRNEDAVKAFRRSIELDASSESLHEGFAEALLKAGDLSGAETEYRAALAVYDAQYKRGGPTDSLHSFVVGLVNIESANHAEHALADMRMKLGHLLLLEKKYDEAVIQAKSALEVDHNAYSSFYLQAEIFDAKGDHDQAKRIRANAANVIRSEAEKDPSWKKQKPDMDPRALFLDDPLWNGESGYPAFSSEIISILEPRLTALSPVERIQLADAYFGLGRVQSAKEQWEKAIVSDSKIDTSVSRHNLGEALRKAGALPDALPHLRRAYELDPQNTTFRIDYDAVRESLRK